MAAVQQQQVVAVTCSQVTMELSPQKMETLPCSMGTRAARALLEQKGKAVTALSPPSTTVRAVGSSQPRRSVHLRFLFLPLCHRGFWGWSPEKKPG